jgi:predicted nucleic acid-binding protein
MTLYVDSSALLKRYVDEHDSDVAVELMATDPVLVTSRLTEIEVRRNLARLLEAEAEAALRAKRALLDDLEAFAIVALDATTCNEAARIAEQTMCRSLDAIHLAAALRTGTSTTLLTFDVRQAQAARAVGLGVVGT